MCVSYAKPSGKPEESNKQHVLRSFDEVVGFSLQELREDESSSDSNSEELPAARGRMRLWGVRALEL